MNQYWIRLNKLGRGAGGAAIAAMAATGVATTGVGAGACSTIGAGVVGRNVGTAAGSASGFFSRVPAGSMTWAGVGSW